MQFEQKSFQFRKVNPEGYIVFCYDRRHNAVLEHRLVMEAILGRPLESHECIHHLDRDRTNNHPDNLMYCNSHGAHKLQHYFEDVRARGGKVGEHKICSVCDEVKPLDKFHRRSMSWDGRHAYCMLCKSEHARQWYQKRKTA